jgi:hypothetical protein
MLWHSPLSDSHTKLLSGLKSNLEGADGDT